MEPREGKKAGASPAGHSGGKDLQGGKAPPPPLLCSFTTWEMRRPPPSARGFPPTFPLRRPAAGELSAPGSCAPRAKPAAQSRPPPGLATGHFRDQPSLTKGWIGTLSLVVAPKKGREARRRAKRECSVSSAPEPPRPGCGGILPASRATSPRTPPGADPPRRTRAECRTPPALAFLRLTATRAEFCPISDG